MNNMIFILASKNFFWDKVRELFVSLDSIAFLLFSKVMGLMFDIANLTTEKAGKLEEFFDPFYRRVYVILSIYMLFKVTVSILTYVVNPDAMTDKNQGAGKLVQRIIVSLIILMFFPTGFTMLNDLQSDIIRNNTIPNLVLGVGGSVSDPEDIGRDIAYKIYNGTFVYVSEESGTSDKPHTPATTDEESVSAIVDVINDSGANDGVYKYDYIFFAGFILGIVLTILTLSMCIDISVRVFKLIILELVAPIPIISYMDPKQSKDGTFSKWLKLTIKTWADIFIRLFVIYFIVLVIEQVIQGGGALVDDTNPFVKIALVIGLLFFAKDAPKFISEAIGIKDVPKGGLTGMISKAALGGIGGMAAGAGAGFFAGGFGGMAAGALNGLNGGFHGGKVADALKQGLDLGTQVRTGGDQTKYTNLLQKAQQASMQHSAARKLGFGSIASANKAFGDYKKAKIAANNAYQSALTQYNAGKSFEYEGKTYQGDDLFDLIYRDGTGLQAVAAQTESKFNDFSSHLGSYGMGSKSETSLEKATKGKSWFTSGNDRVDTSNFNSSHRTMPSASPATPAGGSTSNVSPDPMDLMSQAQSAIHEANLNQQYANSDYNDPFFGTSSSSNSAPDDYESIYQQYYDDDE